MVPKKGCRFGGAPLFLNGLGLLGGALQLLSSLAGLQLILKAVAELVLVARAVAQVALLQACRDFGAQYTQFCIYAYIHIYIYKRPATMG